MDTDYMLASQVAEELKMSRWAVWKAIQQKRLHAEKFGRDWVIHRDEVARFQRERRHRGRPAKHA